MAEKIKKKANKRLANLFSVFTVSRKNAISKETKTQIRAIPSSKTNLSIHLLILNKYNIFVFVTKPN
ncbi:hypothetical protein [Flavobacterium sp. UBA4854]|uniref:hypothetical protein n=1 Tax=Flavobacterium sp. UBA4854 TaxID=1946548 RepID=UPI00257F8A4B|nr:hypothetical protein [Flavobacterium sp. UBA4854]